MTIRFLAELSVESLSRKQFIVLGFNPGKTAFSPKSDIGTGRDPRNGMFCVSRGGGQTLGCHRAGLFDDLTHFLGDVTGRLLELSYTLAQAPGQFRQLLAAK